MYLFPDARPSVTLYKIVLCVYNGYDFWFLVSPEWITVPSDLTASVNEKLHVVCKADGIPKPNIVWKKNRGKGKASFSPFYLIVFFFKYVHLWILIIFNLKLFAFIKAIDFPVMLIKNFISYLGSGCSIISLIMWYLEINFLRV